MLKPCYNTIMMFASKQPQLQDEAKTLLQLINLELKHYREECVEYTQPDASFYYMLFSLKHSLHTADYIDALHCVYAQCSKYLLQMGKNEATHLINLFNEYIGV